MCLGSTPSATSDPNDFTNKYNTSLSEPQETAFREWVKETSKQQKRDVIKDLYDYDLRGLWLENGGFDKNGHATDKYKKPNHITFSNESKYHGQDGYVGGQWNNNSFIPSKTNKKFHSQKELEEYFKSIEPDVKLKIK